MIQRIQTLYLLIVTVLVSVMLFTPCAYFFKGNMVFRLTMILAALLPLVAIILYKKRRLQVRLCMVEIILLLGVQAYVIFSIFPLFASLSVRYIIPNVLPLFGVLFAWLALRAIRRDEALVRSADRIR